MPYTEGQTATNPQTGQKLVFSGGAWQPVPQQAPQAQQPPAFIPGTPKPPPQFQPPSGYQGGPEGLTPIPGGPADPRASNTPPSGYRFKPDGSLEPIPGGPEAPVEADNTQAAAKLVRVLEQIDRIYADAGDANGWFETGATGSIMRKVPGTAAYDLAGAIQTVEANAAFDALQKMRESSPTGGALGQITERELDLLKSSVANMNPNQSQDQFIRQLGIARGAYIDMLRRLDPAKAEEIQNRGNPQFDAQGNIYYDERGREALANTAPSPPDGGGGGPGGGDNLLSQLGAATVSDAAGIVQGLGGATYDIGAQVGDALEYGLRQGGGALLDAANAPQAADWWRGDFQPSPTVMGTVEQLSPTPEGMEGARFASQVVGGMMVPFGPKGKAPIRAPMAESEIASGNIAREVVKAGKREGVRVMTSDVRPPTTFTGKMARATGERIPYLGTGGERAGQQQERIEAVKNFARDFGADVSGDYLDDIAADFAKTRGGQITALSRAKDSVIDGIPGVVQTPRAVAEIDKQIASLRGVNEGAYQPIIQELEAFKANLLSGKSLRQIEENRRILGGLFEGDNLAKIKDGGQKAINAIYGPLRDDMGDFIKQSAGTEAYNKWASANKRLSTLIGDLDSAAFRSVLGKAETTPEQVSRLLFNKQPSEVRRLYQNLSPEGKAKARSGIIQMAIEKAGGIDQLSPDKFANAIAQNSRAAGVVFEGPDLARLQGLERLLQYTKQASVASAAPPTGVQNSQMIGGFVAGSTGPISLPILATIGGLARLYESKLTRNLLIGLSKTKPGSEAEGQWIQRILKATASQTERLGNVANDVVSNSPARAAASDNDTR